MAETSDRTEGWSHPKWRPVEDQESNLREYVKVARRNQTCKWCHKVVPVAFLTPDGEPLQKVARMAGGTLEKVQQAIAERGWVCRKCFSQALYMCAGRPAAQEARELVEAHRAAEREPEPEFTEREKDMWRWMDSVGTVEYVEQIQKSVPGMEQEQLDKALAVIDQMKKKYGQEEHDPNPKWAK